MERETKDKGRPDEQEPLPEDKREEVEDIGGRKTYRTLDEQEGTLSPAEERFEAGGGR